MPAKSVQECEKELLAALEAESKARRLWEQAEALSPDPREDYKRYMDMVELTGTAKENLREALDGPDLEKELESKLKLAEKAVADSARYANALESRLARVTALLKQWRIDFGDSDGLANTDGARLLADTDAALADAPDDRSHSQKMADAGYTRRPSWRALPDDAPDDRVLDDFAGSMTTDSKRGPRLAGPHGGLLETMPNPTEADLADPMFEAIWQATKTWDVNSPEHYLGYCGMNGSHVMLILNAIRAMLAASEPKP